MRVLVAAAAGFIGSNLVRTLVSQGASAVVLDNFSSGYRENLDGVACQLVEGDIRDRALAGSCAAPAEAIFHPAAPAGNQRASSGPRQDSPVNGMGAPVMWGAVSSAAGVCGELPAMPSGGSHPAEPVSPYLASKLGAERQAPVCARQFGVDAAGSRYFNVYGPGLRFDRRGSVIPIFALRVPAGEPLRSYRAAQRTRDFVPVAGSVQAKRRSARPRGVAGAFDIGSAARAAGRPLRFEFAAPRPGDVRDSLANISAARTRLGFEPAMPLDEGLAGYWRWTERHAARGAAC